MPDSVTFQTTAATPPSGTVVSTEEVTTLNGGAVSAQHVQRIVAALRTADGTAIDLPGDSSNGLDVDVSRVQGNVTVIQTTAANLNAAVTDGGGSLTVDDGGSSLTVDGSVSVSGAVDTELTTADLDTGVGTDTRAVVGIVYGASGGAVLVSTTNPLPIGDNGGSLTVDVGAALPAGTNNIGDVDILSIAAGDNNIGNVDVVTLPALPAGTNAIGKLAANDAVDIGDVTINNAAGASAVNIQDGGNSITVDGSVSVSGAITAGAEKAEDAAHSSGATGNFILGVRNDAAAALTSTDADYSPLATDSAGRVGVSDLGGSITVDGTVAATQSGAWNITNISGTVSLPTGAATAAKQPALGTAGSASVDVITVQGIASMTALKTDGSAVTQPVSGTITANAGSGTFTTDQTNAAEADYDTGAGTVNQVMFGVALPASGGPVAGGTSTNPLRTDPTGTTAQPITDNAGSLTVDAPVGTPVNVQVGDGTRTATVRDTGTSDSLNVAIVDASGNQITSFGGGTQYAEDAAHVSGDTGTVALGVRRDADTTPVSADGDYHTLLFDAAGNLKVNVKAGGGTGGTAIADESAFTEGTTNFTPIGGVLNDTITSDPTEDQAAAVRITAKRGLHVNLRNVGGTEVGTAAAPIRTDPTGTTAQPVSDAGGSLTVDGTVAATQSGAWVLGANSGVDIGDVDITSVIPGTGATSLGKAEDAVHASGDTGIAVLAVRRDSAASGTSADGDYATLNVDASGRLWTNVNNTVAVASHDVTNAGIFAVQDSDHITDNAAFTDGTSKVMMAGFAFDEVAGTALTENDAAAARVDSKRAIVFTLEDETTRGRRATVTAANALKVDGSAVTQPVSGTITANAGSGTFTVDSELPAAVALADGAANPTAPAVGAFLLGFDGTDWERVRLDATTRRLEVEVENNPVLGAGTNNIGDVDVLTLPSLPAGTNNIGDVDVLTLPSIPAGTNNIGDVDILTTVNPTNGTASGALGAANAAVTISGQGASTIHWEIDTGTLVGTVVFEATLDDAAWFAINAVRINGVIVSSTTTFSDRGALDCGGYSQVRLRVSAYTSGTSNARLEASAGAGVIRLGQAIPSGDNNIGNVDIVSLPNEGQQTMANSISVAIASDQSAVPASQSGTWNVNNVSGTVSLPTGAATLAEQQTQTTALQLVDDIVHSGDAVLSKYAVIGAVLDDTSPATVTENQAHALRMSSRRALLVEGVASGTNINVAVNAALPAGTNNIGDIDVLSLPAIPAGTNNIGDVDVLTLPAIPAGTNNIGDVDIASGPTGASALQVQGATAHDAAATGNPLRIGGKAESTRPAAVADADAVDAWFDTLGRQVVQVGSSEFSYIAQEYTANQTDASLITAPGAGLSIVIYDILVSTGTVGTVLLEEGTTTRLFGRISLAANGGWNFNSSKGVKLGANTALSLTTTTGAGPLAITVNYAVMP